MQHNKKKTKCCNNQEKTNLAIFYSIKCYTYDAVSSKATRGPFIIPTLFLLLKSIEIYPGNSLVESLALDRSDLELQLRGRAGSVVALDAPLAICVCTENKKSYRKCTSAPRGTTTDLSERGEEGEGVV